MARCDSYDDGQCTRGACQLNPWVEDGWGNGGEWAASAAAAGFVVVQVPTVGAVVCYCEGDGYSVFGHVGTVEAVYSDGTFDIREENYIGPFVWDDRRSNDYDVCGFILPPGVAPGSTLGMGAGGGSGPAPGAGRASVEAAWQSVAANLNTIWPQLSGEIRLLTSMIENV